MNINKIRANKSNLRIAPNTNPSQQYSPLVTIDLLGLSTSPTNNNNNNNSNDRNNTINPSHNHQNIITTPILSSPPNNFAKFASSHSSPSLEDTSNTISVATQNVRGINNTTKKDISIFGLTETMLTSQSGEIMFKNYITTWNTFFTHRAYWDYNPLDRNSGVGIVLKSFVAKYVQKITRHQGLYIAVEVFLSA